MQGADYADLIVIDGLQYSIWSDEIFEEFREADLTAVHVTCVIWEDARATLDIISQWYRWIDEKGDFLKLALTGEDIEAAKAEGKTAIILGFQNTSPFEDDLGLVAIFHALGVRIAQLTYNIQNLVGGSCYEPNDSGLTRFGAKVIQEMNRLGMIVDLSHVGEQTSLDAIQVSTRPVAITHANPSFFFDHPRNKSEEVLKALAANGGILGCSPYTHLIGDSNLHLKSWCEMVARTVDLMGIDHVAIGSDTSQNVTGEFLRWIREGRWTFTPEWGAGSANEGHVWAPRVPWFQSPRDFPNLTAGLREVGFSAKEVAKIMGGNWLGFMKEGFRPSS